MNSETENHNEVEPNFSLNRASGDSAQAGQTIPEGPSGPIRILILEDVEDDVELMKIEMENAGLNFMPKWVDNKKAFLRELESFSPDLILSDYAMPNFSGMQALALVVERYPSIPFIIVTGAVSEEAAVQCLMSGAWDYLLKNNLKRLGPAIENALKKKRLSAEIEQAHEMMRENERYFRSLLHNMHEDIMVVDKDYRITDVNNMFVTTSGHNREDIIGRHCYEISHGLSQPCHRHGEECLLETVFETGEARNCRHEHLHADGSRVIVDILFSPLLDEKGDVTHVIEAMRDVTELYRMETDLRKSEEKYRHLVESTPDWVWACDLEGRQTFANAAVKNILGYEIQEILGNLAEDFIYPEDWKKIQNWFKKSLKDKTGWKHSIARWRHKDGSIRFLESTAQPVLDPKGNLIGFTGIDRDITKRLMLEQQLRQAQKMEAIGTLAGGIAHDFNNILTAIIGNANLALMEVDEDGPLREEIEEIKTAGERAASLTRQLLAFSRKEIIQPRALDFNELLADIEKMLGRLIGEDVELLTILEPALWQVEADPGQVEQVIMNLAVNARDAMPKGGKLTIETANVDLDRNYYRNHGIKEEQPGSYVMLAVSDTGIGMNEETRERIFEPFFTTKEIGKGTGLGLSTIYGIVMQNNGFIWVYSEPGQGTTSKIYLPRNMGDPEPKDKKQTPVGGLDGSETVLVVEDDNALRKLARTVLKQKGYKVLEAENGEDALRISEEHDGSIDLLITDVVMPKMGGRKTAERLQPLYPRMKVIYMSGYTDNAIAHHGVLEPGLNFIEKPFSPKALARKVRETLDGRTEN